MSAVMIDHSPATPCAQFLFFRAFSCLISSMHDLFLRCGTFTLHRSMSANSHKNCECICSIAFSNKPTNALTFRLHGLGP